MSAQLRLDASPLCTVRGCCVLQRTRSDVPRGCTGFGLWACLPDPKRALGAHGVPLIGEVRLRRTSLTLGPCGVRAGYTPPSAVVLVQAGDNVAWHMQGMESGLGLFTGIGLETVACGPLLRPTGARDA